MLELEVLEAQMERLIEREICRSRHDDLMLEITGSSWSELLLFGGTKMESEQREEG